ncbi:Stk1 family PASTA domain-containing Ser/Thr kinase [Microbacterium sediminis]|uniref:non-specific serine/threonine protein kinase n=1 Tax=Microbacterium sediminis TaxID=904291 RepID=A0A1B9N9A7_9MICO|nr:Stk1 family PASTA domain-containing Ser/Thr kinase [Microbacterium sediminis]OCG73170.1 serine/threonine protein kinase [Microbacterium sediminis]
MSTSQQVDPLIGRLVDGRYRVRARIARGGMATVYVATDLRLERRVALKVMHAHLSDDSVFQSRFIQEARSAARLADPHVVNVFDQGQDGELAYLVMEYLPGITLRELLKEQKRLTVTQTITVMDAVLSGLAAAHRAGLIHRDVKPENVLLAEDGRIKIGDFGLARATSANTATGAQLLGTIAYLAPELVTRGTADARSDIYALGIMLYEMLAGEQPYKGEQPMQIAYQHATDSVPRPSVKNPGVPEQLDELVLWATEKTPDERPSDAGEMLERLREIERELGIAPLASRTRTLPDIERGDSDTDATKVLPFASTSVITDEVALGTAPAPEAEDNSSRLRKKSARRSARGGLLLALVLLLAGGAATAGWYWGAGPGSQVAVPEVEGLTFDEAEDVLAAQNLVAGRNDVHSVEVAVGEVMASDPTAGTAVDQETVVTLDVSAGPASVDLPKLTEMTQEPATEQIAQLGLELTEVREYFLDFAAGTVTNVRVQPRGTEDENLCTDGCTVNQGDGVILSVSLGPVPDVSGRSVDEATGILTDAGLQVSPDRTTEYNDTIAQGAVIGIVPKDGTWARNDTVTLIESLGPQLFEVPSVVGMTRDEAVATLQNAGFDVSGVVFPWNIAMNDLTEVKSQTPGGGEMVRGGTTIELSIDLRD